MNLRGFNLIYKNFIWKITTYHVSNVKWRHIVGGSNILSCDSMKIEYKKIFRLDLCFWTYIDQIKLYKVTYFDPLKSYHFIPFFLSVNLSTFNLTNGDTRFSEVRMTARRLVDPSRQTTCVPSSLNDLCGRNVTGSPGLWECEGLSMWTNLPSHLRKSTGYTSFSLKSHVLLSLFVILVPVYKSSI